MMQLSNDDAKRALDDIGQTMERTKQRLGSGAASWVFMLWGVIWMVCFALPYWSPRVAGWGWLIGDTIGIVATIWLFWSDSRKKKVVSDELKVVDKRIWWQWASAGLFTVGLLAIVWPLNGWQMGAFFMMMIMMVYVIMGLWVGSKLLMTVGWVIGVLTVGGYLLAKWGWMGEMRVFTLWMAVVCGGALFLSGLYMRLRWR